MNIYFDKSLKRQFIESQKLSVDEYGYLIDGLTNERITNESKRYIKAKDFGGIRKGSRIFLSKDIDTIINEAALDKQKNK